MITNSGVLKTPYGELDEQLTAMCGCCTSGASSCCIPCPYGQVAPAGSIGSSACGDPPTNFSTSSVIHTILVIGVLAILACMYIARPTGARAPGFLPTQDRDGGARRGAAARGAAARARDARVRLERAALPGPNASWPLRRALLMPQVPHPGSLYRSGKGN